MSISPQLSQSITSFNNNIAIIIKSIQIIKPQLDSNPNNKLSISIILHQLNDDLRKLVRYISSKYAMNLYNNWQMYWNKQKQITTKQKHKGRQSAFGEGQLIICDEQSLVRVYRQMRINPTLRVILIVANMRQFKLKQQHSFILISDDYKQLVQYLSKIKKRLILTSKC